MTKQTEQIDMLFLELSQFTRATTAKEIRLAKALKALMSECPESMKKSETWDNAVILLDCLPASAIK